ncbi:serpin family A member 5 [Rhinolophus ferrumequinum]|uniref:Serpin family A member 5 n=1 Tax=Rhinolophus ferrumequinum TaxID=59479 RepID=A0A671EEW2_RHIFE|nr:plasma serine protease inhibitor [Rhinolophus ferrumequinum]XP_032965025.1 plasma serine protease inhibitor [Rhinolophus ferrumequinum]KAF6352381.1 serpin family A member 5 [Rhinolophus ferrumequinum]
MQLCLLLCLVLLSPQVVSRHHLRNRVAKKKVRELPVVTPAPPGHRDFIFELFRALVAAGPDQNIFFSPLSIAMTLGMISLGARSNTKAQILEGLCFDFQCNPEELLHKTFHQLLQELNGPKEDLQLSLGNALFVNPTVDIQDTFLSAMRTLYLADSFPTDFKDPEAAKKQINDYVAKQTKGRIVDLVKKLDSDGFMVLVNYIFFKAKWQTNFDPKSTKEQDFHVTSERVVPVPMMKREDQYLYLVDRNLFCNVVGVPYQGNATAFFILPNEGKMGQLEAGLNKETLRKWIKMLTKSTLQLYLPKFSIEGSYQLDKVLPKLGITDIFTSDADLTGLSNKPNIQVSEMVHKAVIEVDESGTKAAAATDVSIMFRSVAFGSPMLVFDRPFLMVIVENAENILFLAKVMHP